MPEEVKQIEWQHLNKKKYYLYGSAFSLSVNTVLYPVDLVKTRLQVQRSKQVYKGTFDAVFKIIRTEGVRGLYKGFAVSQFGILTAQLYLTTYEVSRAKMSTYDGVLRGFVAGGLAAMVQQCVWNPVEVVAQRLRIRGQGEKFRWQGSRPTVSVVTDVFVSLGFNGFYRGFLVSLLNGGIESAVWWASYGLSLDLIGKISPEGTSHTLIQAASGFVAGVSSAVVRNPLDIVKTRLQTEGHQRSLLKAFRELLKEGPLALTKGLTANIFNMAPSSVVLILAYETVKTMSLKEEAKVIFFQS